MSAWTRLVDIFSHAGRPLAFFDFETASLDGNPCEFALAVLDSSEPTDMSDPDNAAAVEDLGEHGHGVAYVSSSRLDPGQDFSPGASAIHGITAADIEGCPRFDDPQVIGLFQAMASNRVVWAGHNVFGFDLPLAERLGYIPAGWQAIDSMRLVRRIQAEEDTRPQHPPEYFHHYEGACEPGEIQRSLPAMAGLDLFKATLTSQHYALTGHRFEGAHGALSDVYASIRVMAELVNLWFGEEVFIHFQMNAETPAQSVEAIIKCFSQVPRDRVAWSGFLKPIEVNGSIVYEIVRGKQRGKMLDEVSRDNPGDLEWAAGQADPEEAAILTSLLTSKAAGSSGWLRWESEIDGYEIAKGKHKGRQLGSMAVTERRYLGWIAGLDDVDAETKNIIESALTPPPNKPTKSYQIKPATEQTILAVAEDDIPF